MLHNVCPSGQGAGIWTSGLMSHSLLISCLQERPIRPEQLLSEGSTAHRLTNLAALSDSLDYLAEAIVQFGKHAVSRLGFICCK